LPSSIFSDASVQSSVGMNDVVEFLGLVIVFALVSKATSAFMEPEDPLAASGEKESKVAKQEKALATRRSATAFGWLHADMRVPLPSLEELRQACHFIGEHENRQVYLCTTEQPDAEGLDSCELSDDFTKHYGTNIYLCRGRPVQI